jgi:hypothetical protein
VGEVTNNGQDDATSVTVSGIFYDKNHKVLDTDYTYTKPDTIEPGQKAPFELSIFSSDATKEVMKESNYMKKYYVPELEADIYDKNMLNSSGILATTE